MTRKERIVVAMSGGVDSSTVAAILVKEGYDVIGMTLQLYDPENNTETYCSGIDDAKRMAQKLRIPHHVLNYKTDFKKSVIDKFVDTYLEGKTPIPCVTCNKSIKFAGLYNEAQKLGAKFLATGHYVQKKYGKNGPELHKGIDEKKDQSYFLFELTNDLLEYLKFPLGGFSKEETRKMAKDFGLDIFNKRESQDICFVPNGDYVSVIEKFRPGAFAKGVIKDTKGNILGEHEGIVNYTVGQRKGLGISGKEPYYVIKIDPRDNSVIIGTEEELNRTTFIIEDLNWLDEKEVLDEKEFTVKIRSTHTGARAIIQKGDTDNEYLVTLLNSQKSVSPGQACVIYDGTRVLGGGWITSK